MLGRRLSDIGDVNHISAQDSVSIDPTQIAIDEVAANLAYYVAVGLQPLYTAFEAQGGAAALALHPRLFADELVDWQQWLPYKSVDR